MGKKDGAAVELGEDSGDSGIASVGRRAGVVDIAVVDVVMVVVDEDDVLDGCHSCRFAVLTQFVPALWHGMQGPGSDSDMHLICSRRVSSTASTTSCLHLTFFFRHLSQAVLTRER